MLINVIRYFKGNVNIEVYGFSPERFLNLCAARDIYIWDLKKIQDHYTCSMSAADFKKLPSITRKTKTQVRILKKNGLAFTQRHFRKRKLFFLGILLCVLIFIILSFFIWDISIIGNKSHSDEELLAFLNEKQIGIGVAKNQLNAEEIVQLIRTGFPDIVWVSVQIKGTRLFVELRENETGEVSLTTQNSEATDLVSETDGIITSIITRKGTPLVKTGDEVKAGQILVCGRLDIIGDDESVVAYEYCHADADIDIKSNLDYNDSISLVYKEKIFTDKKQHNLTFILFGKKLCFGRKNKFKNFESSSKLYTLKIGKNFCLPFSLNIKTTREYIPKDSEYDQKQAVRIVKDNLEQFCKNLSEKGVQLLEKNVKIVCDGKKCIATGNLVILNRVKKRQETEIILIQKEESESYESGGTNN